VRLDRSSVIGANEIIVGEEGRDRPETGPRSLARYTQAIYDIRDTGRDCKVKKYHASLGVDSAREQAVEGVNPSQAVRSERSFVWRKQTREPRAQLEEVTSRYKSGEGGNKRN